VRKIASRFPLERVDSKFEARNPKFETRGHQEEILFLVCCLLILNFEFVSDFGFFHTSALFGSDLSGLGF